MVLATAGRSVDRHNAPFSSVRQVVSTMCFIHRIIRSWAASSHQQKPQRIEAEHTDVQMMQWFKVCVLHLAEAYGLLKYPEKGKNEAAMV